ncbi:MAG: hypothetical protein JXA69_12005, partial [Phycisphaerae bacterium]|nr:hypothetical protein [Phycisphaerae bacterium]
MRRRVEWTVIAVLCASFTLTAGGCAATAGPKRAGRSASEKESLVKPGELGGAADGHRWIFDFWNKQVIRQDVPVGTVFLGDSITEFWNLPVYFAS